MNLRYKYKIPDHLGPQEEGRDRRKIVKILFILIIAILIILGGIGGVLMIEKLLLKKENYEVMGKETQETVPSEEDKEDIVSCVVAEGDLPAEIFSKYGKFDANDTEAILAAAEEIYDFTNVKIGQELRFCFDENGEKAKRMEYDKDTEKMIIVERHGNDFDTHEVDIPYEIIETTAKGEIKNFFYVDALELGMTEATVLEMGDVFSFSVDFTTEIREGDEFSVVYEKRLRDGERGPDGKILAAKFVNEGQEHYAYYFHNDGEGGYYDEEGRVLERQFLRAPLSYRRITSGFTGARLHPITRKVTAHYQIDYAAPTGTPVVSTARGTVTQAGYSGGWGNIVRVKHDNGYSTHYAHLSKFAKDSRVGTRVNQGQVVGYVGSTGWSTGPHLDYGMKLNGTPVNPLKLDLPKGTPLNSEKMKEFEEIKNNFIDLL